MFHGGTNFGFMSGGNHLVTNNSLVFPYYSPVVTSYGTPIIRRGQFLI
jgi:hypothetical protein